MYASLSFRILGSIYNPNRPKPWVARLVGFSKEFQFERMFIKGVYDYSHAHGYGKNVSVYYSLPPGLYEVYAPIDRRFTDRYFARVTDSGEVVRIEKEEVCRCLKSDI